MLDIKRIDNDLLVKLPNVLTFSSLQETGGLAMAYLYAKVLNVGQAADLLEMPLDDFMALIERGEGPRMFTHSSNPKRPLCTLMDLVTYIQQRQQADVAA